MSQIKLSKKSQDLLRTYRDLAVVISVVFFLEVLTFKNFFFLDPSSASTVFISAQRILFDIGWVACIFITPLTLLTNVKLNSRGTIFLISWAIWPASLVFIHVSSLFIDQNLYLDYLANFPIFIFTDVIAPTIYGLIWLRIRKLY